MTMVTMRWHAAWRALPGLPDRAAALPAWGLAMLVGGGMNLPVWWRRLDEVYDEAAWPVLLVGAASELLLAVALTAGLLQLAALGGRVLLQGVALVLLGVSAVCAYYMTRFDIVIGYGVISAVLTADHALSGEVVGWWLTLWLLGVAGLPAWWWLRRTADQAMSRRTAGANLMLALVLGAMAVAGLGGVKRMLPQRDLNASFTGVIAHSYLPSNWLAGTGMVLGNRVAAWLAGQHLRHPAEHHRFDARALPEDVLVVVVVGESARWDHFGLFGYGRPTTPRLQAEAPRLAAWRARSCDTSTKLSLACMFVRAGGVEPGDGLHRPDVVRERQVFAVLRTLGFTIDLHAVQGEAGFYQQVGPDFYQLREVLAAQAGGAPVLDGLLLPELRRSIERYPRGRHAVVLHAKGSHYLYSRRYPDDHARWQPVCDGEDGFCRRDELVNAYDNSILYTDTVLGGVFDLLRDRPALVLYTSDHGESIGENSHFHATPRAIAPPEQRRVPLLLWASPPLMDDARVGPRMRRAIARANVPDAPEVEHAHIFSTLLGCLGVTSPDGGLEAGRDLCAP